MTDREVVIVGAGPGGVSGAVALKDAGLRPLLLDQADQVGASWRRRYDRLRLNSSRPLSHVPRRRYPRGTPIFPSRDDVVAHLERHAGEDGIDLMLGTRLDRIERAAAGRWLLRTSAGDISAEQVIVATGYEREPFIPDWPGRERFDGRLLHSGDYANPEPFRGQDVLVVGPGCSGMEIAHDLAAGGANTVWLSARTPPNITLRAGPGGLPGDFIARALLPLPVRLGDAIANAGRRIDVGDLSEYGLPVPEEGVFARLERLGVAPAIVDEEVIEAIKARRIGIVRGVESLDETGVTLADGARVEPHAVICATGFRRGLEPLVGHLEVLDDQGRPLARDGRAAAPGLRFIGYVPHPAQIGYMAKEAKRAAKAIAREVGPVATAA